MLAGLGGTGPWSTTRAGEAHGVGGWWQQVRAGGGWRTTPHVTEAPAKNSHAFSGLALCVHLEPVSPSAGVFRRRVRSRGQTTLRVHTMMTVMLRGPWHPKEWRASRRSGLGGRDCSYPSQLSSHIDVVKKEKKDVNKSTDVHGEPVGCKTPWQGPREKDWHGRGLRGTAAAQVAETVLSRC